MHIADLRRRIGTILDAEESESPDWEQVDRLSDELQRQLIAEPETECPEIVRHYLDDRDIRLGDEGYAKPQREKIKRFVSTGEYLDSTPVPLWTCAVALAVIIGLAIWLWW
jgi:hypothetical protein